MGKRKRTAARHHEPGEVEPCEECRIEIALLRRAQELQEQEGLTGRELVDAVLSSLEHEAELEAMWRRRAKKP